MTADHGRCNGAESYHRVSLNGPFRFSKSSTRAERSQGQSPAAQRLPRLQTQPVPDLLEPSRWRSPHDGEQHSRIHHTHQQEHPSQFLGHTGIMSIVNGSIASEFCQV